MWPMAEKMAGLFSPRSTARRSSRSASSAFPSRCRDTAVASDRERPPLSSELSPAALMVLAPFGLPDTVLLTTARRGDDPASTGCRFTELIDFSLSCSPVSSCNPAWPPRPQPNPLRLLRHQHGAQLAQKIAVLRHLHPVQPCLFAALGEKSHATRLQAVVAPRIHLLSFDRREKLIALYIHHHAIRPVVVHHHLPRHLTARFPLATDALHIGPATQRALGSPFARHTRNFACKRVKLIDHRIDRVLQLQDFPPHMHRNLAA